MGSRLTCDYAALYSHRAYDNLHILQDKDCGRDKREGGGGAEGFSAVLKMNENEKEGGGGCDEEGRQRWMGRVRGGVGGFIVIQEAPGEEHHDSARPP